MTEKTKFEFRPMSFDEQAYSLFVRPLVMQDQAAKGQEFTWEEKTLSES